MFIGTIESIANAKVLLEYHLVHLKVIYFYFSHLILFFHFKNKFCVAAQQEVEQLRQEKLEIDQQLRAMQGSTMGSMQNFPVQRRSERGYSSDMESIRSNRGGPRGRGRGGGSGRGSNPPSRYHPGNNLQHQNSNGSNDTNSYTNNNLSDQQQQQQSSSSSSHNNQQQQQPPPPSSAPLSTQSSSSQKSKYQSRGSRGSGGGNAGGSGSNNSYSRSSRSSNGPINNDRRPSRPPVSTTPK